MDGGSGYYGGVEGGGTHSTTMIFRYSAFSCRGGNQSFGFRFILYLLLWIFGLIIFLSIWVFGLILYLFLLVFGFIIFLLLWRFIYLSLWVISLFFFSCFGFSV